jgi:RecA-family ATPase
VSGDFDNDTADWCNECAINRTECGCSSGPTWTNGTELQAKTFAPIEWIVPNLIPEGLTLVLGAPKVGKSWFILDTALRVAAGISWMGEHIEARPVLHITPEDSERRLQDRTRHLGIETFPAHWHAVTRMGQYNLTNYVEAFLNKIPDDSPPPLVIADTYARVRPGRVPNESSYDYDYRVGVYMKAIADQRPGMGLAVVHHDRKAGSADFVDDVSGTNGLAGSMDTLMVVRRERTSDQGTFLVTGRDVEEGMYAATFDAGKWSLYGDTWEEASAEAHRAVLAAESAHVGDRMRALVEYVNGRPEGTTSADVENALPEIADQARRYLARAAGTGLIDRATRGIYLPKQPGV